MLFVCTHNAGRSIVAAALLHVHQPPGVRAGSAGTDPADVINPTVVIALAGTRFWLSPVMASEGRRLTRNWRVAVRHVATRRFIGVLGV